MLKRQFQIRLDKINIPAEYPRTGYSPAGYKLLKDLIQQHGIIVPVIVRPAGRGEYFVVDGGTRMRIARELGWPGSKQIPATVIDADDATAMVAGIVVNQARERISKLGELRALRHLLAQGMNQRQAGKMLGKTQTWASKMLSIDRLPARVRQMVEAMRIPVMHAIVMAKYADKPKILAILVRESIRGQASMRNLRRIAEEATKRGISAANKRRPRTLGLTEKSWVRLEPALGALRAEVHINDADASSTVLANLARVLAKVRKSPR